MENIVKDLSIMKKNSALFLRSPSISLLEAFLSGYVNEKNEEFEKVFFHDLYEFYAFYYIGSVSINYADYLKRAAADEKIAFRIFFDELDNLIGEYKLIAPALEKILNCIKRKIPDMNISFEENYRLILELDPIIKETKTFYSMVSLIRQYDNCIDEFDLICGYKPTTVGDFCGFLKSRITCINMIVREAKAYDYAN